MSSPFKELYESEHTRYLEIQRHENKSSLLLAQVLKLLQSELLEHDLLWDTRAIMDVIERHINDRHGRHSGGAARKT